MDHILISDFNVVSMRYTVCWLNFGSHFLAFTRLGNYPVLRCLGGCKFCFEIKLDTPRFMLSGSLNFLMNLQKILILK